MVDWSSKKNRIDISDPLNLKKKLAPKSPEFQPGSPEMLRLLPLTIQMGNRNFSERFGPSKIFFQ
ncbi:MAG: hypothetical protein CM1200mP28_14020 [Deltaproteobacteria bacterium]|nr:MAG: hypothetical protein CM1200mP28_14020 [Deltaproteobacteria bacterium]